MDTRVEGVPSTEPIKKNRGIVKWFDVERGYGFVIPASGEEDVMLHASLIRQAQLDFPREGSTIEFTYQRRVKGLTCLAVLSIDNSTAIVKPAEKWESCTVKHIDPRGFVFCAHADGDVFLHMNIIKRCLRTEDIVQDQQLEVRIKQTELGMRAISVRIPQ